MYAATAGQGLGRVVGVVLVVILAAAAGTAVGTVLRDEFRTDGGAPIAATSRTATAAFSLDAIADLQALRAAETAPRQPMVAPTDEGDGQQGPTQTRPTDPKLR